MSEFHFSPRPNRASEIAWLPWSQHAFERAKAEDKPVLLSISAVWCHWCHVMDETTYSHESVIQTINDRFVPVRVDNDERPDVNARYNMGGWPTTAFLAPDGTTLTGATYLPPEQMVRALGEIAQFYAENKSQIESRAAEMRTRSHPYELGKSSELHAGMIERVIDDAQRGYDEEFGGFGEAPKFPQTELLEFLLSEWRLNGQPHLYEMVARTMREMSRGGMYDHVEGGFFRYSTTRDWSVPHFEKMTEDHAGLVRILAQLLLWAPTDDMRVTLRSALSYVRTVLRDPKTALFAGSQDADEAYYELDLESRRAHGAPFVDHRSYTNWTAAMASAFVWASTALDDDRLADEARATFDAIHALRDERGLLFHVATPGEQPRVRGILSDQATYVRALLDAHEQLGDARFLERAVAQTQAIIAHFAAEEGGFYDHAALETTIGRLDVPDRPIVDNGLFADALLRLSALIGETQYREHAERTLTLYAQTFDRAGSFAATYARALRRYLSPEIALRLVAADGASFREAARRLPSPLVVVRTVAPADAGSIGLPAQPHPAAYLCVGSTCSAPAQSAGDVRAAYDAITETPAYGGS